MHARIHYDVTDLLEFARYHPTLSGIQRVSIEVLGHIVNKHGTDRLRLIGWHPIRRRALSFDASYFAGNYKYDQEDFCRHFRLGEATPTGVTLGSYLKRKYGRSWKRPVHHARLLLLDALTAGHTYQRRNIAYPQSASRAVSDNISLAPGDLVFNVGATWNFDAHLSSLASERRRCGLMQCHFVHDLIPVLASEHVVDGVPEHFTRWLRQVSRNTDYLLTNSQATKRDLDAWLDENGIEVATGVVPLAHQFGDSIRPSPLEEVTPTKEISARVRNAARLPYALCVGSIESRKNVWTLANVWKRIHARLGETAPRLIFAGNPGWLRDDFDDFMRATGNLNGYIRVLERPSDAELAFLYRRCLFSVFPSYKEGWGLPVGESLWFGRPVVCSNTSAMPEVGGPLADYVDPTSRQSIEAAVLKMITDHDYRERRASEISQARLRTWSDVADDLWRELMLAASSGRDIEGCETTNGKALHKSACHANATVLASSEHEGRIATTPFAPRERKPITQQEVDVLPWWHSIDLGNGVITKGEKTMDAIQAEADVVFRNGVAGRTVLDIGAWNGAFSFEAERRGACEVTALDHHVWTMNSSHRRAFELARDVLGSGVKDVTCDVYDISPSIGQFDIVLFMGVFYHLKNPLLAMELIGPLAKEMLVVETYVTLNELKIPVMQFFPGRELDGDESNWWGPNISCLRAMLGVLGFRKVETTPHPIATNRVIMHAWR